jgi:peroxiredoxin
MTLAIGDAPPRATFKTLGGSGPEDVSSETLFADGRTVLFAVPGAFTSTCSNAHMPSFVLNAEKLREKGVRRIACLAVNDPFVMDAWAKSTGADRAGILMLTDPGAEFTRAAGFDFDGSAAGLGVRSKRYSMVVEDGRVTALDVEDAPGQATCSTGDALLERL